HGTSLCRVSGTARTQQDIGVAERVASVSGADSYAVQPTRQGRGMGHAGCLCAVYSPWSGFWSTPRRSARDRNAGESAPAGSAVRLPAPALASAGRSSWLGGRVSRANGVPWYGAGWTDRS